MVLGFEVLGFQNVRVWGFLVMLCGIGVLGIRALGSKDFRVLGLQSFRVVEF